MFDEILDLFDRNRRERRNGSRPGLLSRMFGGDHDDEEYRGRHDDDRRRYEDDDDRDRPRPRRRREDSEFDD